MTLTDSPTPADRHDDSYRPPAVHDDHAEPSPAEVAAADRVGIVLPSDLVVALTRIADNLADHNQPAAPSNLTVIRSGVNDAPRRVLGQNRNRRKAHVKNSGANTVYVHSVDGVTPGTGFPLAAGAQLPAPIEGTAVLYAVTDPGMVSELSVLIELA